MKLLNFSVLQFVKGVTAATPLISYDPLVVIFISPHSLLHCAQCTKALTKHVNLDVFIEEEIWLCKDIFALIKPLLCCRCLTSQRSSFWLLCSPEFQQPPSSSCYLTRTNQRARKRVRWSLSRCGRL